MLRLGFAFALSCVFVRSATTVPFGINRDSREEGFHVFPPANSSAKEIIKCCPWGTSFDVNALICKSSGKELFSPKDLDRYRFSIGLPDCLEIEFYRDFDLGLLEANGESYCVDGDDSGTVVVACGNLTEACRDRPCLRKCTSLGEFYAGDKQKSETAEVVGFSPVFYDLATLKQEESVNVSNFRLVFGLPCDGDLIRLDAGSSDVNYLGTNGSLYVPGLSKNRVFKHAEYCIEYVLGEGTFAFVCLQEEEKEKGEDQVLKIMGMGRIASCVCLLLTFFMYAFTRKSESLHGKTLTSYVGCLCITYFSLVVVHLGHDVINTETCIAFGYSILFSSLAAFFWLNVMSIDIWKRFRSLRTVERQKSEEDCRRFVSVSIYAWGMPLLISLICGILDSLPYTNAFSGMNMYRPKIGYSRCWFSINRYGIYIFFVAPVCLIVACNVILYVQTAWRCWKVKVEITRLGLQCGCSGRKYSLHRGQLILNGKLFFVMGLSWGPEVISTIFPHPMWKITDVINSLLGVFLFIIFVAKKQVISSATKKLRNSLRSISKGEGNPDSTKSKINSSSVETNMQTRVTSL